MVILMVNGQKVFQGWKLSPIINRLGGVRKGVRVGIRMYQVEKIKKLLSGGTSSRHSRVFLIDGIQDIKDLLASKYSVSIGAVIWYNLTKASLNNEICSPFNDIDGYRIQPNDLSFTVSFFSLLIVSSYRCKTLSKILVSDKASLLDLDDIN